MPILDLKEFFGFEDKNQLLNAINGREDGAGKSLSATFQFKKAMENQGVSEGSYARVKLSNFYAWFRRGIWKFGIDTNKADTISEFIGSRMASSISSPSNNYESAPKVDLFTDSKGTFGLVSLYVKNVVGSLDDVRNDLYEEAESKKNPALISSKKAKEMRQSARDLAKKENLSDQEMDRRMKVVEAAIAKNKTPKQNGHARLICSSDPNAEPIKLDPNDSKAMILGGYLQKELKMSIALRAMLGDHDGNPGNYLIVKGEDGKPHVAGIDYGHSFNDMIKSMIDGNNPRANRDILSYFNRGTNFGRNKLYNFKGIMPNEDFIDALRMTSEPKNIKNMQLAVASSVKEINELRLKGVSEKEINYTIKTLCARMGNPLNREDEKSFQIMTSRLENALNGFIEDNAKEMQSMANLVEIQVKLDQALKKSELIDVNEIEKIQSQDKKYLKNKNLSKDIIEWPMTDHDTTPPKCSVVDYVSLRAKQLQESREIMQNSGLKEAILDFKRVAQRIDSDNKEAQDQRFLLNVELIQAEIGDAAKNNRQVDIKMIEGVFSTFLQDKSIQGKISWPVNEYNKRPMTCTLDKYLESKIPLKQKSWTERLSGTEVSGGKTFIAK